MALLHQFQCRIIKTFNLAKRIFICIWPKYWNLLNLQKLYFHRMDPNFFIYFLPINEISLSLLHFQINACFLLNNLMWKTIYSVNSMERPVYIRKPRLHFSYSQLRLPKKVNTESEMDVCPVSLKWNLAS